MNMTPFSSSKIEMIFRFYPDGYRQKILALRELIFTTANRLGLTDDLEETLKWGEPSYVCPTGSTVRIGWSEKDPECYKIFFHCQTNLIATFRELYRDSFTFEGNRAIRFELNDEIDEASLAHCIELSLKYHLLKNQLKSG